MDSCERVQCGEGRSCVQDQNLVPHCVRCERRCPSTGRGKNALATVRGSPRDRDARAVCGADGTSYPSACHLREAACRAGKAIPVAYRGRCQSEYRSDGWHDLGHDRAVCLARVATRPLRTPTAACAAGPRQPIVRSR